MKYLSNYIQEKQTALFNATGVFFAFSTKQFNEGKKEGVNYVALDGGAICPEDNVEKFINGLDNIYKEGIIQDLKENGKAQVIERELYNHEAFYTGDWSSTYDSLEGYGITKDEVATVFYSIDGKESD